MESENRFQHLIGISMPTLRTLRDAAAKDPSGGEAIDTIREAGYAGGGSIFDAFSGWALEETGKAADALPVAEFSGLAGRFFESAGWGRLELTSIGDDVALASIDRSWESEGAAPQEFPACHLTTGSLAAFFERLADYPLAVFERSCRAAGGERCEFVIGNSEMIEHVFEQGISAS